MKKLAKNTFNLVILLLCLQVCQLFIRKLSPGKSFYFTTLITSLQFLLILWSMWFICIRLFFRKILKLRVSTSRIVISFAGLMAILEFLTWLGLHNPAKIPKGINYAYAKHYEKYIRNIISFNPGQSVYDSSFFYMLTKDNSFHFKNIEFDVEVRSNHFGLRDDENSEKGPQVICLGDSYTLGWGVAQEKCFASVLEKESGLNVLNTGVSSFGTAREIKLFRRLDTSQLKYIVIQYCGNDSLENNEMVRNNYQLKISSRGVYDSAVQVQQWAACYFPFKNFLLLSQRLLKDLLKNIFRRPDGPNGNDQMNNAKVFLDILAASGVDFKKYKVLVTFVDEFRFLSNGFLPRVAELASRKEYEAVFGNNLETIDLSGVLNTGDYFILDPHLREGGHQKIAAEILKRIHKNDFPLK